MLKTYAIAAFVAIVGLIGGTAWFAFRGDPACGTAQVAGGAAAIGGPFTLVDETGRTVTEADVLTKPTLVYFGYTFCPDVCPTDSARNADALDLLQQQGYDAQAIFITVDPERDTPEALAEFTDYMHPDMLGLTGTPEQVKVATQAYKTFYSKPESDDEYYLVDHMTFTYLMLPETGFATFFKRDDSAEKIAEQAACFIDATN
ncbi:MAG: SCO family protein [Rhodobacteraceae bacterium]|nr:SCO family protein [Paracoccaceae bacterium]